LRMEDMSADIEAWKEVHRQLVLAIMLTKDSISMEKEKRRFLLEEIYLNVGVDGSLDPKSKWGNKMSKAASTKKHKAKKTSSAKKVSKKAASTEKKVPVKASSSASKKKTTPKKRLRISIGKKKEEPVPPPPTSSLPPTPQSRTQPSSDESESSLDEHLIMGSPSPKNLDQDYNCQPQDQALNQSLPVEYQSNEGADLYGMEPYQSSMETTAQTLAVTSQVASHALATNFPTTSSETLFHEILQQQGVDMDEDEEDAF
jgi:hypothetical protein